MDESARTTAAVPHPHKTTLRLLDDLPGPRGLPLLGNALDIKPKELHRIVSGWADQFGPMFVFRVATQRILTISNAETIQQLLRERPERFRRWHKIEDILVDIKANGLFSAEGGNWRRQRKYVMYMLNAAHVREFTPRLEQVAGRLRRRWWRSALKGTSLDVHADLNRVTVDVTSGLAFGRDINTLEEKKDPIQLHLDKMFPAIARRQTALFPYWRYLPLAEDREVALAVKQVGRFIDTLIGETRARLAETPALRDKPGNLLEALVAAQEKDQEGPSDSEIAANVMTMLLAGEDTTANTLSYMIHFLMEFPHVQSAVQEEVDRVIGMAEQPWQDPSTPDRLRYIEAFANETMRCKPVGGHLFLESNEDVQIEDILVPRGTPILALSGYAGTREKNFAQADEFRPERWLEAATQRQDQGAHNTKAFMPFGAGARFCPGRQLAMLQIKMVTAMLCRDFEIERPKDAPPMRDVYNFTVGPTNVHAVLRPRRPARRGIDVEFRDGNRRTFVLPIAFVERRVSDRRKERAASAM